MHFSFSPERYMESVKYQSDIKHDASIIEDAYRKNGNQGLSNLAHSLVGNKSNDMKLMTFDFSYSSSIQYLMSLRNVRTEMIRVLQTQDTPLSKEIVEQLNKSIVGERNNDMDFYNGLTDSEKVRNGNPVNLRENYKNLLNEYPSEKEENMDRIPIEIIEDKSDLEYSPFIEPETAPSRNLGRDR